MHFLSRLFRGLTTLGGVGLLLWLMRDRMVNLPMRRTDRLPEFRSAPPEHQRPRPEITAIDGIGPVYAERLAAAGITSVEALAGEDAAKLAAAAGIRPGLAADWIEQASRID
jgi:predicted flap endonuclease-1-like 5' DNA nuclease